jgi:hypothetical protein
MNLLTPSTETTHPGQTSVVQFQGFLQEISQHPLLHGRFLNTLSFLEYIGSRKILKSQRAESIHFEILSHVAEEIRHAQTFKKLSLKVSGGVTSSYSQDHLFCGAEAGAYFQTIDQSAAQSLGQPDPWTNYLLTTLLIEERANQIYPFYEEILARVGHHGYLKTIVREENSHLQDITTEIQKHHPLTPALLNQLRILEDQAFTRFTRSLTRELARTLSGTMGASLASTELLKN